MKKGFKIIVLLVVVTFLFFIGFVLYLRNFGQINILSNPPSQPSIQIPITYNLGWWTDQKALTIDSLNVQIVESKLNLFNNKSLISYRIAGRLTFKGHWQPIINEVHISERINMDSTLPFDRTIEITPVVVDKETKKVNSGVDKFEFVNEHTINSNHWGLNKIKFICGQKEQIIELHQVK